MASDDDDDDGPEVEKIREIVTKPGKDEGKSSEFQVSPQSLTFFLL